MGAPTSQKQQADEPPAAPGEASFMHGPAAGDDAREAASGPYFCRTHQRKNESAKLMHSRMLFSASNLAVKGYVFYERNLLYSSVYPCHVFIMRHGFYKQTEEHNGLVRLYQQSFSMLLISDRSQGSFHHPQEC